MRVLLTLVLVLYILVALVNYSLVQSLAGSVAGAYFSKEWGGTVRIGSLHATPLDHVILDNVLWVSPTDDTLFVAENLSVSFRRFPFHDNGLDLEHVYLKNVYYHFSSENHEPNFKFVIDYFKRGRKERPKTSHAPFTVKAKTLVLDNVHYKMDLPDYRETVYPYGVQIPHMEFLNINAKMKDVLVVNDDVTCRVVRFATDERSGFKLRDMRGQVHVSPYEIVATDMTIETGSSTIVADAELHYDTWKGMSNYVSTVQHKAVLKAGTRVEMRDVAYWAPVLWGIEAATEAEGTAEGTIDSLTTDMMLSWGSRSSALVAGSVRGLPKIDTTEFDIFIEHLKTNREDMAPLLNLLPVSHTMERTLEAVDYVNLSATLKGGWRRHAAANMLLDCKMGQMRTDVTLENSKTGHRLTLDAESDGMGLALLGNEWMTRTGFSLSADGTWRGELADLHEWDNRLEMNVEGHLTNSVVKGKSIASTSLNAQMRRGELAAAVTIADSLANIHMVTLIDLADSVKRYRAEVEVGNFDLGILPHPLSTHLSATASGNTLEKMALHVHAQRTHYGEAYLKDLKIDGQSDEKDKTMEITSDVADASISGHFLYSDLPLMVRHFGRLYLPEIFNTGSDLDSLELSRIEGNTLAIRARWNDDEKFMQQLGANVTIARGTRLDGTYNFGEQLKMVVRSDSIKLGTVKLENMGSSCRPLGDKYVMQLETQMLSIGAMSLFEQAKMTLSSKKELCSAELTWGGEELHTRGDLKMELRGNEITVTQPWFYVGETQWSLTAEPIYLTNNDRLGVTCEKILFESQHQHTIGARLSVKGQPNDCIELTFKQFNLEILSDILLQETPVSVNGDIDGRFSLYGLNETPYFNANLTVDSAVVNRQPLGTLNLVSNWNAELNMLNLNMDSRQVHANGWLELGSKDPGLNFQVDFDSFGLAMVAPLLASFSDLFEGQFHGDFSLSGTVGHPMILGEALVENGALKLNATDVTYHFADSLRFNNNVVFLKDFDIYDPLGNKATANGTIELTQERKVMLDVDVKTNNLMVLNKKSGEQYYGTLLASADGHVSGPVDHLNIAVRASTMPGCELTIPVSYQQRVKSQNYITFVSDQIEEVINEEVATSSADFDLELDLNITPDMKLNLPMDFKEVSVNAGASGMGDLHLTLNGHDAPQITGDYEITSGTMRVGLFSLYEKRFTIENGSNLNFRGNAADARFDMKAVYSQRANLSTLTGSLSTVDNTQKYIQVENIIAISGTLTNPTIGFDIRLPNADQSIEDEVFAYIDRNSERDMLNQTLSLLMWGSFYNVNSSNQNSGSPLDAVTSFMGNQLTDMVGFVDVNIDYRSATEATKQQLDVNISKDWGRWYLESTLGYGGESRELEASSVNGTVIDALIGYRLSPLVHLYAYNRTNTNDYTRVDLPYKQGVGLKLTKDFDRLTDLFKRKKKK